MSATPQTQVCCCKGSQRVWGNTTWIILPQSVPKFLCGTHTGFYFFFKKKVTHVKRAANGGTSLADKSSLPIAKNVH